MILYQQAWQPRLRTGEMDLAGRRVAARAVAYSGASAAAVPAFDPVERRFAAPASAGIVWAGPFDSEPWARALARAPRGAVLVGPCDASEQIHGAFAAATRASAASGRGVYLVDPTTGALPIRDGRVFVVLFTCFSPACVPEALSQAAGRGLTSGVLLPLIPGWTCESDRIEALVGVAAQRGAKFVAGIAPLSDGAARRAIVEARSLLPDAPDDFFERVHHGDWSTAIERARQSLDSACNRNGLASIAPRAIGKDEPAANGAAARLLEEMAQAASGRDEHRASLLHAAVRWIDESGRDLAAIAREGNLRRIFPFGSDLAAETERALRSES